MRAKDKTGKIINILQREYPQAKIALNYSNPMELLVATILSAQSTDVTVNKVTPVVFNKYKNVSRKICDAKKPKCPKCVLNKLCPSYLKFFP